VDPPPPVEAAGTSLLYSREFHDVLKSRLAPGGVLAHWFPGGEGRTMVAVTRSLVEAFPYVRLFHSACSQGFHFLCSDRPIEVPAADVFVSRLPFRARLDFAEWHPERDPAAFYRDTISREIAVPDILSRDKDARITDDRPFNEYFLLRRMRDRLGGTAFEMW
jgi:hypothetical protein